MNERPRILLFVGERDGRDVYVDLTEDICSLVRWEVARAMPSARRSAIAHLGPSPVEPLPLDEFDDDVAPRSLRFP